MTDSKHHDMDHHVKIYLRVFWTLAALTIITVAASYLQLPILIAMALALLIALVKGSLVAGFFMHLVSEKKMIYWMLIFTVCFFLMLLLMPTFWYLDEVVIK